MPVVLQKRNLRDVAVRARRAARRLNEVAGILVDFGGVVRLVETRNQSKRAMSFWIHHRDWNLVERATTALGSKIVGTFHSHVVSDPVPAESDIRGARSGDIMIIIDSLNGEVRAWRIRGRRAFRMKHQVV